MSVCYSVAISRLIKLRNPELAGLQAADCPSSATLSDPLSSGRSGPAAPSMTSINSDVGFGVRA